MRELWESLSPVCFAAISLCIMLLIKLTCYFTIALWEVFKVHIESSKIILFLFFFLHFIVLSILCPLLFHDYFKIMLSILTDSSYFESIGQVGNNCYTDELYDHLI